MMAALDVYFPTLWDDLDGVRVRKNDPLTSHEAADSNSKEHRTAVENAVMAILRKEPITDEQLTAAYFRQKDLMGWPDTHIDSPRKRRSGLLAKRLVEDSGEPGKTVSGRAAIKWRAVSGRG